MSIGQTDTVDFNFWVLQDSIGVFDVWNQRDTSYVVGKLNITNDTLYFEELQSFYLLHNGSNGVNTSVSTVGTPSAVVKPNSIATKFYFLGNKYELMHFDTIQFTFDDKSIENYTGTNQKDTLHYIKNNCLSCSVITVNSSIIKSTEIVYNIPTHQKRKKKQFHQFDFWLIHLNAYGSIRKFDFDLEEIVGNKVKVSKRVYPIQLIQSSSK